MWLGGLLTGIALVAAYFLVGDAIDNLLLALIYDITGPAAALAIVFGVRRHKSGDASAWYLLAGGIALFSAGDIIWTFYERVLHVEVPFPSIADVLYVAAYPPIVFAFARIGRGRQRDRGALIDATVIGIASGVFVWFIFLEPIMTDASVAFGDRLMAAAYPAMDVPMIAALSLFILTPGARSPVFYLLSAGTGLLVVADIVYAQSVLTGNYVGGDFVDAGWLLNYVLWAVAALHPSMSTITQRDTGPPARLTLRRLLFQSAAVAGTPFILFINSDRRDALDIAITVGAVLLLLGLNLVRLAGIVRTAEQAEVTLRTEEAKYRSLVEQVPAVIYTQATGDEAPTLFVNSHTESMLGYSRAEWHADPGLWQRLLHPDDSARVVAADEIADATGGPYREEYRLCARDGRTVWVREEAVLIRDETTGTSYWQGISIDITSEKTAEAALAASAQQFRLMFDSNPHPMWVYDLETLRFLAVNDSAVDHYGYSRDEFLAMTLYDIRPPEDAAALAASLSSARPELEHSGVWDHCQKNGREIRVEITSHTLPFDGRNAALVVAQDVTQRLELQDQLAHQAFHDTLTGLPNRMLFSNRLEHALARSARSADPLAVLFIDLDGFKVVNDSLGHAQGDELLIAVSERLSACVRAGDTVARRGGDEFTILLEDSNAEQAIEAAQRIGRRLAAPIELQGHTVYAPASIGIACKSSPLVKADDLLRDADVAMYAAKQRGKSQFALFESDMNTKAWARLELESDLRGAIARDELRVYYQPILDLQTGRTTEVEALVRWQHPVRGLVLPGEFIPLAEETGLILPIGWWVLTEACRQVRAWQLERPRDTPLSVSVNISPRMFQHPTLVAKVASILAETALDPNCLRLEITETVMMQNGAMAIQVLKGLRALGLRLAIDDFGTGYSSLAYLQSLPVDILKIDRGFVGRMSQDFESLEIVRLIISLAKTLGLTVVGEGIETDEQLSALRSLGGDSGQGYLFSHPLSAEAASMHLADSGLFNVSRDAVVAD